MKRKHYEQACGCLFVSLLALGLGACAGARVAQEINKRRAKPEKIEQRQVSCPRIMPSHCR